MESDYLLYKENGVISMKSKNKYENLKNDYFLQKVFNNVEKKKLLNIVKYNKNIKKKNKYKY